MRGSLNIIIGLTCFSICHIANADTQKAIDALRNGNVENAVQIFKLDASTNDIQAQFYMGQCYEYGIGIEADSKLAFGMYRRAAERGHAPAMVELARCYRDGIGVEPNERRATEWQNRSSKRQEQQDAVNLVEIYNNLSSIEVKSPVAQENLAPVNSKQGSKSSGSESSKGKAPSNPTTISRQPIVKDPNKPKSNLVSDVDIDIPSTRISRDNVFALIIANENYQDASKVSNAINDGEIFSQYCQKTLGLPQSNVHLIKDATLNNIKRGLNLMKQISEAYKGEASFIIFYAGHGIPDEKTKDAFLMPVDGFSTDISTCYRLSDFYEIVGSMNSRKTIVLLDACFSGSVRGDGMLMAARGVAIKPKTGAPSGKTIVISSAQGDETAYPYEEKQHGLFTYFLLKKLKESRGDITLSALVEYLKDNVSKKSLVANGKQQTPAVNPSQDVSDKWENWKLD